MVKKNQDFSKILRFKSLEVVGHKHFRKIYDLMPDGDKCKKQIREIRDEMLKDTNKGEFIKKKPYPDRYRDLGVKNLYVYDIWSDRLIYTIRTDKDKKIYQYLDYLTHKEYDVLFGYSTS
jgi:hypothetical protein